MKLNEFGTHLQQLNHDFVAAMQARDDMTQREVMFDQFDWHEEYMAWMIKQHRHIDDPVRVEASTGTIGPSVDPARGDRPKMQPVPAQRHFAEVQKK